MHSLLRISAARGQCDVGDGVADDSRRRCRILLTAPAGADTAEISFELITAGFRVSTALTLDESLQLLHGERPSVWLLDARLLAQATDPADGRDWLRRMARGVTIILHFPAGASAAERMQGLQRGADRVLAGPMEPRELLLHITAALRLGGDATPPPLDNPLVHVDEQAHEVFVRGNRVHTTPLEFALLRLFVRNAGRLLSQESLKAAAWREPAAATDHALREHVSRLRAKLGVAGGCIETVRGTGFRFRWPETESSDVRDVAVARAPENRDG